MVCFSFTEPLGGPFGRVGAWEREARCVALLAAEMGVALDDQALLYCDVRDLMALRLRLQKALHAGRRLSRRADRTGVLALRETRSATAPVSAAIAALATIMRRRR